MTPKISIIMPVYNAEKYLHRAIDSILAQTMRDFELLLIDDGSTDASGAICDEYAQKDPRIQVFHKQNEGVAMARQTGLDAATGEYSIHADSDDWVEPTMLEELHKKAKEDDADMVICDFFVNTEKGQSYRKQQPTDVNDNSQTIRDLFQQLHGSCCNKLVRRACYSEYGIHFPEDVNYCEDLLVNVQLLKHDIKVSYLHMAFYHYFMEESSLSNSYSLKSHASSVKALKVLTEVLPDKEFKLSLDRFRLEMLIDGITGCVIEETEARKLLSEIGVNNILEVTQNKRWVVGLYLLYLGFYSLSSKLLHY